MQKDFWLPRRYPVSEVGCRLNQCIQAGEKWQIYSTDTENNLLVAVPELTGEWCRCRLLDKSVFKSFLFGEKSYQYLICDRNIILSSVALAPEPKDSNDAFAFAAALKISRSLIGNASLHDGIYIEQYSRILPVWSDMESVDDGRVLGGYLTGGVGISVRSFERLAELVSWMPSEVLNEVIETAGLSFQGGNDERIDAKEIKDKVVPATVQTRQDKFSLPGRKQLEDFFNDHVIDIVQNQERYKAMGIDFPSPIVLYGPTGCGKTFAVDKLVEYLGWPCYSITSNSIGSPYIHATSKKISEMFDQAIEHAPSVLVIDEMDAFLSERQGIHNHHLEEVAEFLRRIPEAPKKQLLVIGMTNLLDVIDPAIIRRGRFDHLIEVGMPSRQEVSALLISLLEKIPKEDDINLDMVEESLAGRALSDVAFVVREAARLTAKNGQDKINQENLETALQQLPDLKTKKKRSVGFV